MIREWTARKQLALNTSAIDSGAFARAYTLHRADPEPAAARREVIRLLAAFSFLWLPLHSGICWLSTYSLGLASGAVLLISAVLLAVALAKWLALEDVLQKLPLLLVLALIGLGLVYFTTLVPPRSRQPGNDLVMGLVIVTVVISVLGGLYVPMAAAYQSVTIKTHARDLCIGGAAMLLSIGVVAVAHSLPKFAMEILACALAGSYSGMVVVEYAAWARANPEVSLERAMEFGKRPGMADSEPDEVEEDVIAPGSAVLWATFFGLSFGLIAIVIAIMQSPSEEVHRLFLARKTPHAARELLQSLLLLGIFSLLGGFYGTSISLSGQPANPLLAFRLAGHALLVFLTYPETTQPLVHRFRIAWLRPRSVRLALTGLTLVTAATAIYSPTEKPSREPAIELKAPASATPYFVTQPAPRSVSQGDLALAAAEGDPPEPWLRREVAPLPADTTTPSDAVASPVEVESLSFVALAVGLVLGPPIILYSMTCFVGLTVLPTYFRYFECPATAGSND